MEAEIWVIHLQAKEPQKFPESTRTQWGGIEQKLLRASETSPVITSIRTMRQYISAVETM